MDITKKQVKLNSEEEPNMQEISVAKIQETDKEQPFEGISQECLQKVQKLPEQQQLIDQYKKLMNIKNNLYKLDCLIEISRAEQNQEGLEELEKMRNDLLMAIQYQEDAIKAAQNSDDFKFSVERLTKAEVGRACKAFYEKNNKWYNAKIDEVDDENQEVKLSFIGYGESRNYSTIFAKLIPEPPNPHVFEVGTYCEAIYSGDGHYYPCLIENITLSKQYQIKFKKYNERDTLPIYYLREQRQPRQQQNPLSKLQFEDLTEFKLPESLKILPNDSELQRKAKKKKVKALKNAFKNAVIEKDSTEKKDKWKNFQGKRFNRESIFSSPDNIEGKVGVMNSGKGMTNFKGIRPSPNDNSHLSRLF